MVETTQDLCGPLSAKLRKVAKSDAQNLAAIVAANAQATPPCRRRWTTDYCPIAASSVVHIAVQSTTWPSANALSIAITVRPASIAWNGDTGNSASPAQRRDQIARHRHVRAVVVALRRLVFAPERRVRFPACAATSPCCAPDRPSTCPRSPRCTSAARAARCCCWRGTTSCTPLAYSISAV